MKHNISLAIAFFFFFFFIFKLYITVLVLPNIKMNPPQVYIRELDVNLIVNRRILLSGEDLPWFLHEKNAVMVGRQVLYH